MQALPALSNLGRKIQQWRALRSWERRYLAKLFFLLPCTRLLLRLFGFNASLRIAEFDISSVSNEIDKTAMERAHRYAHLTAIAARCGILKANCLHRSLALCWLLRRQGLLAKIRIGVRPNIQPFQAHAWVELNGTALGEAVEEYKAFDIATTDPRAATFI